MNNFKIQAYNFKQNKQGTIDLLQTFSNDKSKLQNSIQKSNSKDLKLFNYNTPKNNNPPVTSKFANSNNLVSEVNKIIKTPALNISSKLDSKGK